MAAWLSICTATPRPPPPHVGRPSSISFEIQRSDLPSRSARSFLLMILAIGEKGLREKGTKAQRRKSPF
ncbi:hypothetical protein IPC1122_32330 [Pseudomonas aeruginosa]|nr:hypothetical protein IPC1122_32330 [Pseudomonas aeruginosa]